MIQTTLNYNTDETERRCFDALIVMMQTRDLDKCPTSELLERSGISRSTFYRHYKDKYEVLNRSYQKLLEHTFLTVNEGYSYKKTFLALYSVLKEHHEFFRHAFRSDGQNSLKQCIYDQMYASFLPMLQEHGLSMKDHYNHYLLCGYLSGTLDITYRWIMDGAQESPEILLKLVYALMPEEIRTIVALYYM